MTVIEIKTTLPGGAELTVRGDDYLEVVETALLTSRAWRDRRHVAQGLPADHDEQPTEEEHDGTM